jgi:endo-1,3(4)-beta-glucanase
MFAFLLVPVTGLVDGSLIAPLVQGAPYITMKYGNLTPLLKSQHAILNVNGQSGQVSGTKFRIALNNGQTWILYALDGSLTLNTESGNTLRATGRYSGVLRVALELTEGHQTVLDAHSSIYPIAGCISYCALVRWNSFVISLQVENVD